MAGGRVRMPVAAGARKATLYDVSTDEIRDVFDAHPDEARRLHDLLRGIHAPAAATPLPTPDAGLMKSLRQQGYW